MSETASNILPPLIDSHAHLDAKRFERDVEDVIVRAHKNGIVHIIQVGTEPESWSRSLELARSHPGISTILGLQPHDCEIFNDSLLDRFRDALSNNRGIAVGIGECGLDFHYDMPKNLQRSAFAAQLKLAGEMNLPISIHTREADSETLALLNDETSRRGQLIAGVMHCFSGGVRFAQQCLSLGLDLSFSGVVTFPNAGQTREAAIIAPPDRIHVETDCPYLAPAPVRGQRCESAYVRHTAEKIAEIRGCDVTEFCAQLTANTRRLFHLNA
jgi:TatD DNase family protein